MIFWSGKGFFSILFVLLGIMITQGAMEAATGQKPEPSFSPFFSQETQQKEYL